MFMSNGNHVRHDVLNYLSTQYLFKYHKNMSPKRLQNIVQLMKILQNE